MIRKMTLLGIAIVLGMLARAEAAGELWYLDSANQVLEKRDANTTSVQVALPGPGMAVAAGADGGVWISLPSVNQVWHCDTLGTVSLQLDTQSNVQSIAVAADGTVWCTRPSLGDVVHYGEDGSLEHQVSLGGVPYGVATDVSGVWVTLAYGNQLVRLDNDGGVVGQHPVEFYPTSVASHPDGTVWVVEKSTVAHLAANGELLGRYAAGISPRGLTIALDGSVWVSNQDSDEVTRFAADGSLSQSFPVGGKPWGMGATGDGRVWVLCRTDAEIWRLNAADGGLVSIIAVLGYPHGVGDLTGLLHAWVVVPSQDQDADGASNSLEAGQGYDPLSALSAPSEFVRGDSNGDSTITLGDVVGLLEHLFLAAATDCPEALDVNDDATLGIADAAQLLAHLVGQVPALAPPFPLSDFDPIPLPGLGCAR